MSIKEKIAKEFNRTPVTASSAVVAIFVAMGSFIVAVLQYKATSITATASFEHTQVSHFNISNFLLILSYFSAVSIIGASFVRLLARKHDFHALVLSIPIAALINFSTFIVLNLAPPTKFTSAHLASANDLIFWATLIIFVAFCGKAVMSDLLSTSNLPRVKNKDGEDEEKDNSIAVLVTALILLAIWGGMVSYGQKMLTRAFLPDNWQPISANLKEVKF